MLLEIDKLNLPANISMLRLDLIDPHISGNKWYKLKNNIAEARRSGYKTILTFGGAFSNHIYATAAAAQKEKLKSIGIIRGEAMHPLNSTLSFARNSGMNLHFISRTEYRRKNEPQFKDKLKAKFGDVFIIPEGGSNDLAVKGVSEIVTEIKETYDLWITPVGTGGTMAGLIAGLKGTSDVLGISALKGVSSLEGDVKKLLNIHGITGTSSWSINHDYHFGGYAKITRELYNFIATFKQQHGILLDPIYTGKMMFALNDLIKKGFISTQQKILALHTGGIQGWKGMIERYDFVKPLI